MEFSTLRYFDIMPLKFLNVVVYSDYIYIFFLVYYVVSYFQNQQVICLYSFKILISWVNLNYCEKGACIYIFPPSNWRRSDRKKEVVLRKVLKLLRTKSEP